MFAGLTVVVGKKSQNQKPQKKREAKKGSSNNLAGSYEILCGRKEWRRACTDQIGGALKDLLSGSQKIPTPL